jgi:hypothetical protein
MSMARLYGKGYTRQDLARRTGLMEQVAGVRLFELADGWGRGVRAASLRTGSGFSATILIDRGLDIYDADFCGAALAWVSPTGPKHPAFFEEPGYGWLRSFYGGLCITCGVTNAGAPSVDQGEPLGLHGRFSHSPASNLNYGGYWQGDDYIIFIEGEVRQARVFNENLLVRRRIEAVAGHSALTIEDTVSNEGFQSQPHMMLYHINLGFPVVDNDSRLITPARSVIPRDDVARPGIQEYDRFTDPIPGYREQVFYHDMQADDSGHVTVAVVNPGFNSPGFNSPGFNGGQGLGVYVRYRQRELPRFIEWKMTGEDVYTVGLEPANCLVEGRAKERERSVLQFLAPGEKRIYHVEIGIAGELLA